MAGRVFDRMAARFGKQSVFIDVDSIPLGTDFRVHIRQSLKNCDVLLVLIGSKWLGSDGRERIQEESDPVRVEVETALEFKVPVIPVLIDATSMPDASALPSSLREFAFINAARVDSGRDFHHHIDALIAGIDKMGIAAPRRSLATWLLRPGPLAAMAVVVLAVATAGWFFWRANPNPPSIEAQNPPPPTTPNPPKPPPATPSTAAALPQIRVPALPADPCEATRYIASLAAADFTPIRLAPSGLNSFETLGPLPGFAACRLTKLASMSYMCDSAVSPTRELATQMMEDRARALATCLAPQWQPQTLIEGVKGMTNSVTSDAMNMSVSPVFQPTGQAFQVNLMIFHMPGAAPVEPPAEPVKAPAEPAGYCPDLQRVIAASPTGFAPMVGRRDGDSWWISRVQLAGFQSCDINEFEAGKPRRYYSCSLGPFGTSLDAESAVASLGANVKTCLGDAWTTRSSTDVDGRARRYVEGVNDQDPSVEIRTRKSFTQKSWQVMLDVNMPR